MPRGSSDSFVGGIVGDTGHQQLRRCELRGPRLRGKLLATPPMMYGAGGVGLFPARRVYAAIPPAIHMDAAMS